MDVTTVVTEVVEGGLSRTGEGGRGISLGVGVESPPVSCVSSVTGTSSSSVSTVSSMSMLTLMDDGGVCSSVFASSSSDPSDFVADSSSFDPDW